MKKTISKAIFGAALCLATAGAGFAQANQSYQFRAQDRDQLKGHYQSDVRQYQAHPENRSHYSAGQQLSTNDVKRFKPVPASYSRNLAPPPRGYRMGYSQGNVVAYNPTTRVIADVLDLVAR